jgi:hypothetical protein
MHGNGPEERWRDRRKDVGRETVRKMERARKKVCEER